VIGLSLSAHKTKPKHEESQDLFSGKNSSTSSLELISILQAKLGSEAIKNIRLIDDPRPEISTQFNTYQVNQGSHNYSYHKYSCKVDKTRLRPSLLFPKPKLLREKVTLFEGPERIATGWWDDYPIVRDYFVARAHSGAWLWVFRTPDQHWYLHGVFS
jgi:protein ImuB